MIFLNLISKILSSDQDSNVLPRLKTVLKQKYQTIMFVRNSINCIRNYFFLFRKYRKDLEII